MQKMVYPRQSAQSNLMLHIEDTEGRLVQSMSQKRDPRDRNKANTQAQSGRRALESGRSHVPGRGLITKVIVN